MLVVTDFGQRVQTPWRDAFHKRSVQPLAASTKSKAINQQGRNREEDFPFEQAFEPTFEHYSAKNQLVDYQRIAEPEEKRQAVQVAEQIMSAPVVTMHVEKTVADAWKIMQQHGFRHLPIIDHKHCLQGLISDRDLLRAGIDNRALAEVMQTKVLSAAKNTSIRDIAEVMTNYRIGALPLIDGNNHIEGIVTRHDILKAVMHQMPIELWT